MEGKNESHLFLANRDGSSLVQLTDGNFIDREATFAPDSKTIYFLRVENPSADIMDQRNAIYSIQVDGSSLRRIFEDEAPFLWGFSISPDGKTLLVKGDNKDEKGVHFRVLRFVSLDKAQEQEVIRPNLDPFLKVPPEKRWNPLFDDRFITDTAYSLDGGQILFVASAKIKNENDTTDAVYLLDLKTKTTRQVADVDSHFIRWPSFSSDGREVIFCSGFPYACERVWTVKPDSSDLREVKIKF